MEPGRSTNRATTCSRPSEGVTSRGHSIYQHPHSLTFCPCLRGCNVRKSSGTTKKGGALNEVRRLRKLRGWSQVELAERAGVSAFTVTEIETGRREPRPSTLRKLANALGVEIA